MESMRTQATKSLGFGAMQLVAISDALLMSVVGPTTVRHRAQRVGQSMCQLGIDWLR